VPFEGADHRTDPAWSDYHHAAKALRSEAEKMITLAKNGSLQHAVKRSAMYDKQLVHALFEQAPSRYGNRPGGYTVYCKPCAARR